MNTVKLYAIATEELQKTVEEELQRNQPKLEDAKATIDENTSESHSQ
jgi:hypothetical protein